MPYLDKTKITSLAFRLYRAKFPLEDIIWYLAEISLLLLKNFTIIVGQQYSPSSFNAMQIAVLLIHDLKPPNRMGEFVYPTSDEITTVASGIYLQNYELEKLHWFLAEKMLLWEKFSGKKISVGEN
jgi:hypothetical protein